MKNDSEYYETLGESDLKKTVNLRSLSNDSESANDRQRHTNYSTLSMNFNVDGYMEDRNIGQIS